MLYASTNVRRKFLVMLVKALPELGKPKSDQIDTLIRDMIKDLVTPTNKHRQKKKTFG